MNPISEKRLQRLRQAEMAFEQSGEAIIWLSLDGKVLYTNRTCCNSLGYTSDELTHMSIWEIDPVYTKEIWEQTDWKSQLAESKTFRTIHKTKSGKSIPVEVNAKYLVLDHEAFLCAFVRDMSDVVRSDHKLQQTQRRLEEALRSGNVGLWDWDMVTGEVTFSAEWKTQVGLPADAALEGYPSWEQRLHPDDFEAAVSRITNYLDGTDKEYVSVFRFRHEDGSYRWIRAQGNVFKDEHGKPERMIGVHVDITDQKRAEMILEARTAELEAIFHASPDIFFQTDPDGTIRNYRVSSEANAMLPATDFVSKRMQDLVPEKVANHYDHAYTNLASTGQSQTIEYHLRIDGHLLWHQAVFVPFQTSSVAIFIRDITDRKSSELDLIARTRELERSNSDLDQFAYVASHDLKTPLRGIEHLTKWIREDSEGQLPLACNEHLDKLDEQVVRMQSLLDDLLQYSRAGRVRVAVESIDLDDLVSEIISLVNPPQTMQIEIETGGLEIETGRAPLFHVLLNLIENAIKYHDRPDGRVEIRAIETSDIEFIRFEIADDGPGIDAEHHERIFRMFQRLDAKTTGSGMGLAVVRKMIESRGGAIQLVSESGCGTRFFFTWPSMRDLPESGVDE